jgi:hypothetical protein
MICFKITIFHSINVHIDIDIDNFDRVLVDIIKQNIFNFDSIYFIILYYYK